MIPIPELLQSLQREGMIELSDDGQHGRIVTMTSDRLLAIAEAAQAAYNQIMAKPHGELARCNLLNKTRIKAVEKALPTVRAICRQLDLQTTPAYLSTPDFWVRYFEEAFNDDWCAGRTAPGRGHRNWSPDFAYLLRDEVVAKVFDRAMTPA